MTISIHRQLLKDAYQEIENQKHKTDKPMTNQQKQLQSILSEVGINLTENQALAVLEANELLRCNEPSYSQVMEFKEKYAPKREKQDGVYMKGLTPNSFGWEPCQTKQKSSIILVNEKTQKANQDKCISIEDANKIVSNACSYLASHYNENNQPER